MAWYRFDCSRFWVSRENVRDLPASDSTHVCGDAATTSCVSLHDNDVPNGILRRAAQTIFTSIFKN